MPLKLVGSGRRGGLGWGRRAALISRPGAPPELAERDEPQGELVVEVTAAPLNPVDLAIASGRFYAGPPRTPYVPGVEGIGRTPDGQRVWFETGAGYLGDGAMAAKAAVDASRTDFEDRGDTRRNGLGQRVGTVRYGDFTHQANIQTPMGGGACMEFPRFDGHLTAGTAPVSAGQGRRHRLGAAGTGPE